MAATNHAWIDNVSSCAFDRLFIEGNVSTADERWLAAMSLNRFRLFLLAYRRE